MRSPRPGLWSYVGTKTAHPERYPLITKGFKFDGKLQYVML